MVTVYTISKRNLKLGVYLQQLYKLTPINKSLNTIPNVTNNDIFIRTITDNFLSF